MSLFSNGETKDAAHDGQPPASLGELTKATRSSEDWLGQHQAWLDAQRVDHHGQHRLFLIDHIEEDPDQPRTVFRGVAELAESIKQNQLLQPITVRVNPEGRIILMYGARRLRAAKMLHWTHIPTMVRLGVQDAGVLSKQLVENVERSQMDPMDEARGLRRYMRENKIATYREAAERLGVSLGWATSRANLLDLSEEDQDAVSNRQMTIGAGAAKARAAKGSTRVSAKQKAYGPQASSGAASGPVSVATRAVPGGTHFSLEHPLAGRVTSRCKAGTQTNPKAHIPKLGGIACGACWEAVIRADESKGGRGGEEA